VNTEHKTKQKNAIVIVKYWKKHLIKLLDFMLFTNCKIMSVNIANIAIHT